MEINQEAFRLADLLVRYLQNELSLQEEQELQLWLAEDEFHQQLFLSLYDEPAVEQDLQFLSGIAVSKAWAKVQGQVAEKAEEPNRRWLPTTFWHNVAASLLLVSFLGITFSRWMPPKEEAGIIYNNKPSQFKLIPPSKAKPLLTLEDGTVIPLENTLPGTVQDYQGLKILEKNGQLIYLVTGEKANASHINLHTISTPKGVQHQVVLPDGSRVWLNAASSLRFPTAFTGSARQVKLTGEGYFEVAKNKQMPFKVEANGTTIEVLGTHFNLKAYPEEKATTTTLIEGSVKVSQANVSKLLRPGQQAKWQEAQKDLKVMPVELDEVLAWKNGLFQFNETPIPEVLRQVARWYDVEYQYQGSQPNIHFTGQISRQNNLNEVLNMLELTGGIHFKIKNKVIEIIP